MKKIITLSVSALLSVCASAQWDTLHTSTNTRFLAIAFTSAQNGVAAGQNPTTARGAAYHTTDGGQSWTIASAGTPSYNDVFFSTVSGWIVADSGYVLQSTDAGQSWGTRAHIGTKNFNAVYFPTDTVGYIGGDGGVLYRTADFGATWDTLNSGTILPIRDIFFQDDLTGWIAGNGGYVAKTTDGGQTWTNISQPFVGFFQCTGFALAENTLNAFAVGYYGDFIHSLDGGTTWSAVSLNTNDTLQSVRFTNALAGIICGDSGIIRRTNDGGLSWGDESMSYVKENLTGICFVGDTLAYICGSKGRILKSRNNISGVHPVSALAINVSAFPNPFENELNLVLKLETASTVQIEIVDVSGRTVANENQQELSAGQHLISLQEISSLNAGMYFVRVTTASGSSTLPVIRE